MVLVLSTLLPIVISTAAFVLSVVNRVEAGRRRRVRFAERVVVFDAWPHLGDPTGTGRGQIVVGNDGSAAISIDSVGTLYGCRWTFDRGKPQMWGMKYVNPKHLESDLLGPGRTLRLPAPPTEVGQGILGPYLRFRDADGRVWFKTTFDLTEIPPDGRPRRRDAWFERRSWFERVSPALESRAMGKLSKRPQRIPWEVRFVRVLWGWRTGMVERATMPRNAPRAWRYAATVHWDKPEFEQETGPV